MSHHELKYPRKVQVNDITVRDGFQHEEIWIPTDAKIVLSGRVDSLWSEAS